jgi:DNA helicase-2/ATP-dependent DNA helicase PcrA
MNQINDQLFTKRYNALNPLQKLAVDTIEGPVLVVAGPGSGKTELLALRIANIIKIGQARPEHILALTFTESACNNMRERLLKIMGKEAHLVPIFTFHSFCTNIISKYPEHFFDAHHFEPISDLKQNEILSNIFSKLPYGHPLYGYHEERGYAYFGDTQERIKNCKEAGLSPQELKNKIHTNTKELEIITPILQANLPARVTADSILPLITKLSESKTELGSLYADSIETLREQKELGKIKSSLLAKDENGDFIFKEEKYTQKLLAVADIYLQYQEALWKQGYFDFNDMILYVRDRLHTNNELRAEIEETYQYILVDEFQDTNNAQLGLITSITSNEVLEGRANVFVVGDDDQSIYKFQGAELSNIFNFRKMYTDVQVIVLTNNYRSTQKVLDFAQKVIAQGTDRLATKDKTFVKELLAQNTELKEGEIYVNSFGAKEQELLFVADTIRKTIETGVTPEEIAVISRNHSELQELLPYLDFAGVPYNYERKESVFDQKHIEELITICAFLETVGNKDIASNDELLSKILSFEFLGIERIAIWQISNKAYTERREWLSIMLESDIVYIRELAQYFIELGILAKTTPLEIILDLIIGSREIVLASNENEDEYYHDSIPKLKSTFVSKYKQVYFGEEVLHGDIASYVHFLSSLRVFIYALREYKKGEKLLVQDLSQFVSLHKEYNIALLNKTAFAGNTAAINIMTAHKAKGLEFEYVFVIGAENSRWTKSKKSNKLLLPKNMPYDRKADTYDDFLRLFFVALTRAKHTIYLSHSSPVVSFIADSQAEGALVQAEAVIQNDSLINRLSVYSIPPFARSEEALLKKVLENYMLSPTHLSNFLNVTKGGPKLFLEQNLLRFPQSKSSSSVYGSAMHRAVEMLYVLTKKNGSLPSLSETIAVFENEIRKSRLLESDESNLLKKGCEKLTHFYESQKERIRVEAEKCKTEVDFKHQGVTLGGVLLTGKIDRIYEGENGIQVIDIKSGNSFTDFEYKKSKNDDYENIKKHNYKQQLLMYKILLEESREYRNKNIIEGTLSFIDSDTIQETSIDFSELTYEEIDDFKKLLIAVYTKIVNLDFPDISQYEQNVEGIIAFEKDLIAGKI